MNEWYIVIPLLITYPNYLFVCKQMKGLFTLGTHESEKLKLAVYDAKKYKSVHSLLAVPINCHLEIDE